MIPEGNPALHFRLPLSGGGIGNLGNTDDRRQLHDISTFVKPGPDGKIYFQRNDLPDPFGGKGWIKGSQYLLDVKNRQLTKVD